MISLFGSGLLPRSDRSLLVRLLSACFGGTLLAACQSAPGGGMGATSSGSTDASTPTSNGSADEPGDTTAGTGDAHPACTRYIGCVAAVDPGGVAVAVEGYGPEGTCWTPETTELCEQACKAARRELWDQVPEESACADCESDTDCPMEASVCDVEAGSCIDCTTVDPCVAGPCGEPPPECSTCRSSFDCDGDACFEGQCGYAPLLPIAPGNLWSYEIELMGMGPECPVETVNFVGEGGFQLPDGRDVAHFVGFCFTDPTSYIVGTGDMVDVYDEFQQHAAVALQEPVTEGFSWESSPSVTFSWTREPSPLEVPAGSFDDCWTRLTADGSRTSTYCRGVGKVRDVIAGANGFTATLMSYELY